MSFEVLGGHLDSGVGKFFEVGTSDGIHSNFLKKRNDYLLNSKTLLLTKVLVKPEII